MKNKFYKWRFILVGLLANFSAGILSGQIVEWRLIQDSYSAVDPDGAGPAVGTVIFGIDMRSSGTTINDITQISVGFSYQDANLMVPTTSTCTNTLTPNNVVGAPFASAGFLYTVVQQCNTVNVSTGGHTFDRTTAGTLDNGTINLTSTFTRALTVTMWAKAASPPEGGYAMINSGEGGSPGPLTSYGVTQSFVTPIIANSLTYTNPIPLGTPITTPVLFTDYKVNCGDNGTLISWRTASEENSSHFVIEKNNNGSWKAVDQVVAAGNSSVDRDYRYIDLEGGVAQYRIKQVDKDGQFTYTAISYATCEDKKVKVFIYPVPARDVLNVAIRTEKALRTNLEVFDMSGRMVTRQAAILNSGNNNITVNVGHLASGEYVIRSSDGTIQLNKKFTIIH